MNRRIVHRVVRRSEVLKLVIDSSKLQSHHAIAVVTPETNKWLVLRCAYCRLQHRSVFLIYQVFI
jgi:hypothetical protein